LLAELKGPAMAATRCDMPRKRAVLKSFGAVATEQATD
jgi:hypothetical protein